MNYSAMFITGSQEFDPDEIVNQTAHFCSC